MSDELLVKYCSPTLAGIKVGSLFSYPCEDGKEIEVDIKILNSILNPKGIWVIMLCKKIDKALIYVYRPRQLSVYVEQKEISSFLKKNGYNYLNTVKCLECLSKRLVETDGFPHEIGVFLGYPIEDVKSFIENDGKNYKLLGYWKVYGDREKAIKLFERYKRCKDNLCQRYIKGTSLYDLCVAS